MVLVKQKRWQSERRKRMELNVFATDLVAGLRKYRRGQKFEGGGRHIKKTYRGSKKVSVRPRIEMK